MKFEINLKLLKKAKERGFCLCDIKKSPDGSNICPCDDFFNKQECKCGVFKKIIFAKAE